VSRWDEAKPPLHAWLLGIKIRITIRIESFRLRQRLNT
jgi:hypothetical protein